MLNEKKKAEQSTKGFNGGAETGVRGMRGWDTLFY